MNALELYLRKVKEARGIQHVIRLDVLRDYIKAQDETLLIKAIRKIKDPELLRILWEAGLKAPLQQEVIKQLRRLGIE